MRAAMLAATELSKAKQDMSERERADIERVVDALCLHLEKMRARRRRAKGRRKRGARESGQSVFVWH